MRSDLMVRLAAPAVLFLLVGCDSGLMFEGEVVVPQAVLQRFSTQRPGQVVLRTDLPDFGVTWWSSNLLCEPGASDLQVPLDAFEFGCARVGTGNVEAWVVPAADTTGLPCDQPGFGLIRTAPESTQQAPAETRGDVSIAYGTGWPGRCGVRATLHLTMPRP